MEPSTPTQISPHKHKHLYYFILLVALVFLTFLLIQNAQRSNLSPDEPITLPLTDKQRIEKVRANFTATSSSTNPQTEARIEGARSHFTAPFVSKDDPETTERIQRASLSFTAPVASSKQP